MCNCVRDFWGRTTVFLGLCLGSSGYRQCLWSDAWRNNLVSASRARSSIWKTSEQSSFKSFAKESTQPIFVSARQLSRKCRKSICDNTDKTIAVNTMCRALRERPWHFNCCNRYNRWFATDKICSTCTEVEFRAEGRLKTIYFVFLRLIWSLFAMDHVWTFWNSSSMEMELCWGTKIEVSSAYLKDAIIGRECLEIHRINQISRRSYTRTLDYTTSDWEPFGLLTTRNDCLLATCKKLKYPTLNLRRYR